MEKVAEIRTVRRPELYLGNLDRTHVIEHGNQGRGPESFGCESALKDDGKAGVWMEPTTAYRHPKVRKDRGIPQPECLNMIPWTTKDWVTEVRFRCGGALTKTRRLKAEIILVTEP
ncbi:MAG: hypothetical protein JSS68_04485 [Actinobacteria bacterium]|nr:hypothetical protein [Actinomycetota bacterium]